MCATNLQNSFYLPKLHLYTCETISHHQAFVILGSISELDSSRRLYFNEWLSSHRIMSSSFIRTVVVSEFPSSSRTNKIPLYIYLPHLLIHSFIKEPLNCFHFGALVNYAAVNQGVQILPWDPAFSSFGHTPRNRIAVTVFLFLIFYWVAAPFYVPPTTHKLSSFSTCLPTVLISAVLVVAILMSMMWCLIMAFVCFY